MNYEKTIVSLVYCMIGSVYDGVYLQILYYAILNPSVRWRETCCMYRKYVNLAVRATAVHRRRYGERTTNGMLRLMTSQKKHCNFHRETATFEHRHENKSCSAYPKDQT